MTLVKDKDTMFAVDSATREIVNLSRKDVDHVIVTIRDSKYKIQPVEKVNFFSLPDEKISITFRDKYDTGARDLALEYAIRELLTWVTMRGFHRHKKFLITLKNRKSCVKVNLFMFDDDAKIVM